MRRVSMREANQNFSSLVAKVESGESLILERRGVPVAEIIPFRRAVVDKQADQAWDEMLAILGQGIDLGGKAPTKDELYDR